MVWIGAILFLWIAFMAMVESRDNEVARTVFLCTVLLVVFLSVLSKSVVPTSVTVENVTIHEDDISDDDDANDITSALETR